jgi:hypothetical protein
MGCGSQDILVSKLATFTVINQFVHEIRPEFESPGFVSIERYCLFVVEGLRNQFKTLMAKLSSIL